MDPVLYEEFASAFTAEWNKLQAEIVGDQTARAAELVQVKAQLEKLVDALCNGTAIGANQDRMRALDSRRQALEAELANAVVPAPQLHPNLAVLYREKVATLTVALERPGGILARDVVRSLVEEVRSVPFASSYGASWHQSGN